MHPVLTEGSPESIRGASGTLVSFSAVYGSKDYEPDPSHPRRIATRLGATGADLERQALEAFVVEGFRGGRTTTEDLRKALAFEALNEVDGFLKAHGVYKPYGVVDLERERRTLDALGL
jgi:hypothetical protein